MSTADIQLSVVFGGQYSFEKLQSDYEQTDTLARDYIKNKPDLVNFEAETVTAETVIFDETPTGAIGARKLQYSPDEKTLEFGLADGGKLQIGKEMFEEYTNIDTVPLTNGMIVSTAAISGNRKGIKRTDFTSLTSIRSIAGMVTVASIWTNQSGRVTTKGIINELNTDGIGEGSQLWGNPAVLGGWSGSKPAKPQYAVQIGQVVVASATVGSVELNVAKDVKFSDLADVNGSTNLIDDTDTIPKRDSDGIIREITVADIKADFKTDTDALYEPLLGFTPENTANKGQANGYASLGADGLVPSNQLPSFVDDVLEFANLAAFPVTGEQGKIYVALDTNKTYRWSGSAYIYITSGAVDSVAGKTGVVTLVKGDVGLANVDNTSDANKPVSTAQAIAIATKVGLTGNETIAGVKTFSSSPIVPNPTTSGQALNKGTADGTYVALTGAQNVAGVKTFTDSPVVPNPVNNGDAANKAYVQSVITVGNDTFQLNKEETNARINSLENVINSANINQEATATATGVDTIALPKTAANTSMRVQLFGDSDATKNVLGTGRVRSVGNNLIKPTYIQGFQVSTTDGTFVAGATFSRSDYFRVAASTAYILSSNTNTGTDHRIAFYDLNKAFISGATQTSGQPISVTSPTNAYYAIVSSLTNKVDTFRLTRGTSSFETYRESILQLTSPELRSNGLIKDEIRKGTNGYELVKRVGVGTLGSETAKNPSFTTTSDWTVDTANGVYIDTTTGKLVVPTAVPNSYAAVAYQNALANYNGKLVLIKLVISEYVQGTLAISPGNSYGVHFTNLGNGTFYGFLNVPVGSNELVIVRRYDVGFVGKIDELSVREVTTTETVVSPSTATVFANNVHLTLTTPTITPIAHAGLLNSNSNGTAYFEPIIADAGVYASNLAIQLTDYPISSFESIRKYANGTYTEFNTATAVIASGGLSFTHPDLVSGDLVMFTYAYNRESIGRSMTLTHFDSRFVVKDTANANVYRITPTITNGVLTWTLTLV